MPTQKKRTDSKEVSYLQDRSLDHKHESVGDRHGTGTQSGQLQVGFGGKISGPDIRFDNLNAFLGG